MGRINRILAAAAICAVCAGAANAGDATDERITALEKRIAANAGDATDDRITALEKRIAALEKALAAAPERPAFAAPATPRTPAPGAPPGAAAIELASWDCQPRKGEFGAVYHIVYALRNGYDKPVKLVDGVIEFADLLGQSMYGIKLTRDVSIAPGKTASFAGDYGVNEFMSEQGRLGAMAKSDVVATLSIRSLVFVDNSIASFEK